ncbi:hypothetical protein FRC10_003216 [Ceratobasidium sp. 414]|nr:hypothetical protein FRC10_003216 [Ceratobasidium sp. 414]
MGRFPTGKSALDAVVPPTWFVKGCKLVMNNRLKLSGARLDMFVAGVHGSQIE